MLYVYRGTDTKKSREKLNAVVLKLREKHPEAVAHWITADTWQSGMLGELLGSRSLFAARQIVVLDGLITGDESWEEIESMLDEIKENDSIFFILEESFLKAQERKIEKCAEKVVVTDKVEERKESFNVFALTDAIGARDRRAAWTRFHEARNAGIASEDIFWKAVWQVKNMILVTGEGATVESTGMKPYPFQKAVSSARNFDQLSLRKLHADLLVMYHDTRRGLCDFDTSFESLLLNL